MKNVALLFVFSLVPAEVYAHADHAPKVAVCAASECTKGEIEAAVPEAIKMLVKKGKADAAWSSAKIEGVELKTFKKGAEWVATVRDETAKDVAKNRLYVYITKNGVLNGSNFTGK